MYFVKGTREPAPVGPIETQNGTSYVYRIGNRLSVPYANSQSARHAARARFHSVLLSGLLEPVR